MPCQIQTWKKNYNTKTCVDMSANVNIVNSAEKCNLVMGILTTGKVCVCVCDLTWRKLEGESLRDEKREINK